MPGQLTTYRTSKTIPHTDALVSYDANVSHEIQLSDKERLRVKL